MAGFVVVWSAMAGFGFGVVGHGWVWGLEWSAMAGFVVVGHLIFFFFEQISNHCGERETTRQIYICGG